MLGKMGRRKMKSKIFQERAPQWCACRSPPRFWEDHRKRRETQPCQTTEGHHTLDLPWTMAVWIAFHASKYCVQLRPLMCSAPSAQCPHRARHPLPWRPDQVPTGEGASLVDASQELVSYPYRPWHCTCPTMRFREHHCTCPTMSFRQHHFPDRCETLNSNEAVPHGTYYDLAPARALAAVLYRSVSEQPTAAAIVLYLLPDSVKTPLEADAIDACPLLC